MTYSKLLFYKFKKFFLKSVFGELQLTQVSMYFQSSYCNLKITDPKTKLCVVFLFFFYFERKYKDLTSKSLSFLLNENIKFNKMKMETKMENTTHSFREMNYVIKLV